MKIKTLTYTERKVLAQYEYAELTSTAELSDDDNEAESVIILMEYVRAALNKEVSVIHKQKEEVKPEPVVEEPKKEKKTKAKKEKAPVSDETSNIPVAEEVKEAPKKVKLIAYDSSIAEHKSIFGGYLTKKYENSWKTSHPADEIKSFTASLNGKDFLDNDGKIVESFLNLVHGFFGA